jgi:hypothetical protein
VGSETLTPVLATVLTDRHTHSLPSRCTFVLHILYGLYISIYDWNFSLYKEYLAFNCRSDTVRAPTASEGCSSRTQRGAQQLKRKAGYSHPSTADIKNVCSYTCTSPYFFMCCCLIKHRSNVNLPPRSYKSICLLSAYRNNVTVAVM